MLLNRPTIRVGECLALEVLTKGGKGTGNPRINCRPSIMFRGESWRAARASYCIHNGEIPRTPASLKIGIVMHSCDNEWCVEPAHLTLGDQKKNIKDAWARNANFRENHRNALKGNTNSKGKKWSDEAKGRHCIALKGNANAKGKKHKPRTPEQIERYRQSWTPERKMAMSERMAGNDHKRKA